jgi:hypothetical protein
MTLTSPETEELYIRAALFFIIVFQRRTELVTLFGPLHY